MRYRTAHGSVVEITGEHNGIVLIDFDWFEEGACIEAKPSADCEMLTWYCDCCGGGSALLVEERT